MSGKLSIGDFSRMTFLSIKALRHYQDAGLLMPADIDARTGYRFYELDQVSTAQVIRRFRDLGMPLERIKEILDAPTIGTRNDLIVAHLKQMESDLERTKNIVASLRALLEEPPATTLVEYRSLPSTYAAAITGSVEFSKFGLWFNESLAQIAAVLRDQNVSSSGPQGGLFPTTLFTEEVAVATLFIPVAAPISPSGDVYIRELAPMELAVAVHRGPYTELDRTFGALGAHVVEHAIGVDGPIREHYLVTRDDVGSDAQLVTEIGWPIFRTGENRKGRR